MRDARKRSREDTNLGVLIGTIQRHECRDDDLRLVFREFPILGLESAVAARAALASRAQGLYEPPHWALLVADVPFDLDHIPGAARSVGLDAERLARDMEDPALDALIARNAILANALRVRGTPAFVIGDRMIRGALPLKQFRAAIADARVASEGARCALKDMHRRAPTLVPKTAYLATASLYSHDSRFFYDRTDLEFDLVADLRVDECHA